MSMSTSVGAPPVRPSKTWYLLAALLVVAAIAWLVLGLLLGFRSLSRRIDGFQRAQIPGQTQVSLAEPGGYVIYYEAPGASAEGFSVPSVHVNLFRADNGEPVQLSLYGGRLTYSVSGHQGRAVATFHVDQPGQFMLESIGTPPGPASLAVGRGIGGAIAGAVVRSVLGTVVLFFGGVVLAVVVAVRRRAARRAAPWPAPGRLAGAGTAALTAALGRPAAGTPGQAGPAPGSGTAARAPGRAERRSRCSACHAMFASGMVAISRCSRAFQPGTASDQNTASSTRLASAVASAGRRRGAHSGSSRKRLASSSGTVTISR